MTLDASPTSPSTLPARSARPHWFAWVLPFLPIALALLVAFVVRGQRVAAPHTATATTIRASDLQGRKAPDFTLPNGHAKDDPKVTLSLACDQGPVILLFYRSFSCHICTQNLQSIIDAAAATYPGTHFRIIAVSADTLANIHDSNDMLADVPYPLLADPDSKIAEVYGLYSEDTLQDGAFVIDAQRVVQFVYAGDVPLDDPDKVLKPAKALLDRK